MFIYLIIYIGLTRSLKQTSFLSWILLNLKSVGITLSDTAIAI